MSTLAKYMEEQKDKYMEAVRSNQGSKWTVAMGNEAGDLDSLASATAFAWYRSAVENIPTVSLCQTPRSELRLRAENLHALELAGFDPSNPSILCIDELPITSPFPSTSFALVDHNHLLPRFSHDNPEARVVAVIDHHEDEGFHRETAEPRIVTVPAGSASSLVAQFLQSRCGDQLPSELAMLLLCGVLIDTDGLKPRGKAEEVDRAAAAYLVSRCELATASLGHTDLHQIPEVKSLTSTLSAKKSDVSQLNTIDLLRRDYKEYSMTPATAQDLTILVGLATIPIGLKSWFKRDGDFWSSTEQFMDDRGLAVLGILTSFRDEASAEKGKHRREQLYLVREGLVEGLGEHLFHGLKHAKVLDLKKRHLRDDYGTTKHNVPTSLQFKVWEQGNVQATRKVTAPLVKSIIESKADATT
ncbi:DHH phosphoesterase [Trametopsis cervina]|nr:DHH phosphoesterase [Trametopsis cervina]